MVDVRLSVAGALSLLVVDVTLNEGRFEYAMTDAIVAAAVHGGVQVVGNNAKKPATFKALLDELAAATGWNALLLVAHGGEPQTPTGAHRVRLCEHTFPWPIFSQVDVALTDKLVLLCVCHGDNESATDAILENQLSLVLVAPTTTLTNAEARAFFPPFLAAVALSSGTGESTPEAVRDAVATNAARASRKMRTHSAVGFG